MPKFVRAMRLKRYSYNQKILKGFWLFFRAIVVSERLILLPGLAV